MKKISTGLTIAVAAIGLLLTMVAAGVLTSTQTVPSGGTISAVNVGVYTDSGCTVNCTNIDWGTLAPSASTTKTVYIKNAGTVPVTLSMIASAWVPSNANSFLIVTWNRAGSVLTPNTSVSATLTLTSSASAGSLTAFSFNIIITGTQ